MSLMRRAVLRYSVRNRRRKARLISEYIKKNGLRSVAVVGALGSGTQRNESVVELALSEEATIVAALDIEGATDRWPFVVGDGRALPWRAGAVDLIVANAVIEHVGDRADQECFMTEHRRVGRHWVISTPNRWFPIESHTSKLFLHWSPGWRRQRDEFTRLLSLREFRQLLPPGTTVVGSWWSATFIAFSADA